MWCTDLPACVRRLVLPALLLACWTPGAASPQAAQVLPAMRPGPPPTGPVFELEYVVPEIHKWYEPRHLAESYMQPWHATDDNYARDLYRRYVDHILEGDEFYDVLGNPLGRGWLVYSWTQQQPQPRGSDIIKRPVKTVRNYVDAGFGVPAYEQLFHRLVIASDQGGRSSYRLMVGDQISTRFTPLTFSKPRFSGVRLDGASDRYSASLILSRPSDPDGFPPPRMTPAPGAGERTNVTHLMGGHANIQVGHAGQVGLTYVNAHNAQTELQVHDGNPLRGALTLHQNQSLATLWVRLRDDSPEDLQNGTILLAHDIVLVDTTGRELRGSQIGLIPRVEGQSNGVGALAADGSDSILLEYDLSSLDHEGVSSAALRQVSVELTVADDYQIEMASDLQTDGSGSAANIVFLSFDRAAGNVQDKSNTRVVSLTYGLPVASEILGIDWRLADWHGLSAQGEVAINRQYRRYPNPERLHHHQAVRQAPAAYGQVAYQRDPWMLYAEGFTIHDAYSTQYWLTASNGLIQYSNPTPQVYEFVDDDDDQDGVPDWDRPYQPANEAAWPGYDEDRDFINDTNQNRNLVPDYEEPFLRFRSDRPEFLFGLDMNHNGWIDRFENDEYADYPYRRDHRGYNAYCRVHLRPGLWWTVGRQSMDLMYGDGRTRAWYALGTWRGDLQGGGRVRVAQYSALVRDSITDDLKQWFQPIEAQGRMQEVPDILPAPNTWRIALYADLEHRVGDDVRLLHRAKWDWWWQREGLDALRERDLRTQGWLVGAIDKIEWSIPLGMATVQPRWKSEMLWEHPVSKLEAETVSVEQTAILLLAQPLLAERTTASYYARYGRQVFNTELQVGLEANRRWMLEGARHGMDQDHLRWTGLVQLTNRVAYEGYMLVTRAGLRLSQWRFERDRDQRTSMVYMTVNAGLR